MRISSLIAGTLAVLATASAMLVQAAPPDWVGGNARKYPNDMYVVGRGVGSTAQEAQMRARGEVAQVFVVTVAVDTTSLIEVNKVGGKEQVRKTESQQVSAKSEKVLSGVEIAESWRDPATMDFHALAVLEKAKAAAGLRDEIAKVDAAVKLELETAKNSTDALLKLGAMQRAFDTVVNREAFQASLKVIDPSGRGVEAPITQAVLRVQMGDILRKVKIFPQVDEDDDAKEFFGLLKGGVGNAGFLAQGIGKADLILIGKLSLNDIGMQQGWHWVRANVEISLVEKESGRVRGSKIWPLKASGKDPKTARARVMKDIEKMFKEELRPAIVEFASS